MYVLPNYNIFLLRGIFTWYWHWKVKLKLNSWFQLTHNDNPMRPTISNLAAGNVYIIIIIYIILFNKEPLDICKEPQYRKLSFFFLVKANQIFEKYRKITIKAQAQGKWQENPPTTINATTSNLHDSHVHQTLYPNILLPGILTSLPQNLNPTSVLIKYSEPLTINSGDRREIKKLN